MKWKSIIINFMQSSCHYISDLAFQEFVNEVHSIVHSPTIYKLEFSDRQGDSETSSSERTDSPFEIKGRLKKNARSTKRVTHNGKPKESEHRLNHKNIVKNYGNAIASFSTSTLSMPYLEPLAKKSGVRVSEFHKFVLLKKGSIHSIGAFKELFELKKDDDNTKIIFKTIFQRLAEVFIKFFSVNWIFSGKLQRKEAHLRFRYKMLRRIQNPHLFNALQITSSLQYSR